MAPSEHRNDTLRNDSKVCENMALLGQWLRQRPWIGLGLGSGLGLLGLPGWFMQGSMVDVDGGIDHPLRVAVVRTLTHHPGLCYRELQTELNAANGTLRHHLDVLQRRKDIRTVHVNGRTCYFLDEDPVARHGSQARQQLPIGLSRVQRAILIELQTEGPAASQAELARRIGRSRATVHSAVNVLRRRGILRHDALEFLPHL